MSANETAYRPHARCRWRFALIRETIRGPKVQPARPGASTSCASARPRRPAIVDRRSNLLQPGAPPLDSGARDIWKRPESPNGAICVQSALSGLHKLDGSYLFQGRCPWLQQTGPLAQQQTPRPQKRALPTDDRLGPSIPGRPARTGLKNRSSGRAGRALRPSDSALARQVAVR